MSKTRQWVIGAAVVIVLIMVAGWFLLVSPQRAKAAELRTKTGTEQAASAALRTDLAVLTAQAKRLPLKQAELAKFGRQVPSDAALPSLIRALQNSASTAGASLLLIEPQPPAPWVGSGTAPVTGPAPTTGRAATTGLQSVSVKLKLTGSYVQLEQVVANLEGMTRVFLVTGYSMSPSTGGTGGTCGSKKCLIELDLTGQVFTAQPIALPPPTTSKTAK